MTDHTDRGSEVVEEAERQKKEEIRKKNAYGVFRGS